MSIWMKYPHFSNYSGLKCREREIKNKNKLRVFMITHTHTHAQSLVHIYKFLHSKQLSHLWMWCFVLFTELIASRVGMECEALRVWFGVFVCVSVCLCDFIWWYVRWKTIRRIKKGEIKIKQKQIQNGTNQSKTIQYDTNRTNSTATSILHLIWPQTQFDRT